MSLKVKAVLLVLSIAVFAISVSKPALASNFLNHLAEWNSYSHTFGDSGYRTGVDQAVRLNDKPSAFFQAEKANQKPTEFFVLIWQDFDAKKFAGKRIEFSGFVKTKEDNGWANAVAKVCQDGKVLKFDNMDTRRITHADDWQKFSIVLDVPPQSNKISIGFYFTGGGKAWLNGLSVKAVDPDVKTTEMEWDPKKFPIYSWDDLRAEPENLDFALMAHEEGPRQILKWATQDHGKYEVFDDRECQLKQKPSASIRCIEEEARGYALLYQDIKAANYLGKRVKLSGLIKTKDVKDWAGLWMRVNGLDSVLGFDNMEERPVKGTTDWQPYSIVLDVPEQSKKIRLGFLLAGSGQAWLNNLSFSTVGTDVSVTAKNVDLSRLPPEHLPSTPDLEFRSQ
jgi:hypothetical protein